MHTGTGGDHDISCYRPTPADLAMFNPYLKEVREIVDRELARGIADPAERLALERTALVQKYAFSIPTAGVLRLVADFSPIVEIGAGSGYWAMCLASMGADVAAFDRRVPGDGEPWDITGKNQWFDDVWFTVDEGDDSCAGFYPDRALLICWPPLDDPMAFHALRAYRDAGGRTVIFIGDAGASGDRGFHEALGSMRCLVKRRIPGWPGFQEEIVISSFR